MLDGQIWCACNQPSELASDTSNPPNLVLVQGGDPAPDTGTWRIGLGLNQIGAPMGIFLTNKANGRSLTVPDGNLHFEVVEQWDASSTWYFSGNYISAYSAFGSVAIPFLYLNVLGGCGQSQIGVYPGTGAGNNSWKFHQSVFNAAPPSNFRIVSRCDSNQYVYIDKNGVVACAAWQLEKSMGGGDTSIWTIEPAIESTGHLFGGVSIVNAATGQAMKANTNQAVSLINPKYLDSYSVWNFAIGQGTSQFVAICPIGNSQQNLNIQGDCNGYNVITFGWSGGDPNETWQLVPYGAEAVSSDQPATARA